MSYVDLNQLADLRAQLTAQTARAEAAESALDTATQVNHGLVRVHRASLARVDELTKALEDAAHAPERIAAAYNYGPENDKSIWVDADTTVWELACIAEVEARAVLFGNEVWP